MKCHEDDTTMVHTLPFKSYGSVFNTFVPHEHIEMNKSDSKDIHNISNKCCSLESCINKKIVSICYNLYTL